MPYRKKPKIRDPGLRRYHEANPTAFGGELSNTRWGRSRSRIISDATSMNLTLRSSQAKGKWSFREPRNFQAIERLTHKFAERFNVEVIRLSNVHNHLHYHVRFTGKKAYVKFIRALTAAIAISITGCSRWSKALPQKFWDLRPFTRVIRTANEYAAYDSYLDLNDLEAEGFPRFVARRLLSFRRLYGGIPL